MTMITAKLPTTASMFIMSIAHSAKERFKSIPPGMLVVGEVTLEMFGCSEGGNREKEVFQEGLGVTGRSMRGWDKEETVR